MNRRTMRMCSRASITYIMYSVLNGFDVVKFKNIVELDNKSFVTKVLNMIKIISLLDKRAMLSYLFSDP